MSDVGGIQLLPETRKKVEMKIPGENRPVVFASIFAGLILIVYFGLWAYNNKLKGDLDRIGAQLTELEKSRNKTEEANLLRVREQLKVVKPLIEGHVMWSEGFAKLQGLIHPQVYIDSLTAQIEKGEFVFKAYAANYATIAKQIAAFYSEETIKDVNLGKITGLPNGKLEFNIQLAFDIDKMLKKNMPTMASREK